MGTTLLAWPQKLCTKFKAISISSYHDSLNINIPPKQKFLEILNKPILRLNDSPITDSRFKSEAYLVTIK